MIAGIVGLPNVGKSALFNLLTLNSAPSSAYPYCTVEPNEGVASMEDPRLVKLAEAYPGARIIFPSIKFIDVAGLAPGASRGEGLGNQFLSHIRCADALIHVIRAFKSPQVCRFDQSPSTPLRDLELVETELFLADLDIVNRRLQENPDSEYYLEAREKLHRRRVPPPDREGVLLTTKKSVVVVNITSGSERPQIKAKKAVYIDVELQSELAKMSLDERSEFIEDIESGESNAGEVLFEAKKILNLITFFTLVGGREVKGYNVPEGTSIKEAAGKIHTDMEKGFIRAKVYNYHDLEDCRFSLDALKKEGKLRTEGREYAVKDGDVVEVLFSS